MLNMEYNLEDQRKDVWTVERWHILCKTGLGVEETSNNTLYISFLVVKLVGVIEVRYLKLKQPSCMKNYS